MTIRENNQNDPNVEQSFNSSSTRQRILILHNDDLNTFDHVIESLIEVCKHDSCQAEQCAYITHFKGKCDIMRGDYTELAVVRDQLIEKSLNVTIE